MWFLINSKQLFNKEIFIVFFHLRSPIKYKNEFHGEKCDSGMRRNRVMQRI